MIICIVYFLYVIVLRAPIDKRQLLASEGTTLIKVILLLLTIILGASGSRPFLVAICYKPPDSPMSIFNEFEEIVNKVDAENWEFFFLGDINVDLMLDTTSANAVKL